MINNRRDRTTLLSAARLLRDELAARSLYSIFRPARKLPLYGGWTLPTSY